MTFGTRVAVGLAASATIVLLSACGRGSGTHDMRAVLTDDGCTYEGDQEPGPRALTVEVQNHSSVDGAFALAGIARQG